MAGQLQLIAGTLGKGRATYEEGEFIIGSRRLPVGSVQAVEVNGSILESSWAKRLGSGVGAAVATAQLGALTGLFVGGVALVGPYALTAAAIGAGVGLLGGGTIKKALVQVLFKDGNGFIAVCEAGLPEAIRTDMVVEPVELAPAVDELEAGNQQGFLGRAATAVRGASEELVKAGHVMAQDATSRATQAASAAATKATGSAQALSERLTSRLRSLRDK